MNFKEFVKQTTSTHVGKDWLCPADGKFCPMKFPDICKECEHWPFVQKPNEVGSVIDANQDQRDQLTTRLSLRRDK